MQEQQKWAAVLFSLVAIMTVALVIVLSLSVSMRRADVPSVVTRDAPYGAENKAISPEVGMPFFVTTTKKNFDRLTLKDIPGLEFNYGGRAIFSDVQTPDSLYISNGDRILKYDRLGVLLGVNDASVVSSTREMIRYRNSLFVLGYNRLVEVDLATEKVLRVYLLPFDVRNLMMAASERYVWVTHLSDIARIDPSTQEVRFKKYTKSDVDPSVLPSGLGISFLRGDEVLFSPGDNSNYKWGNLRINELTEEETYDTYEPSVLREPPPLAIEAIYDSEGGWRATMADIRIGQGASSTVIPTKLHDYYAMIRFDKDRYYLASSAGIESLDRGQLVPTVRAGVQSEGFPLEGAALILSKDRRFVGYLGTLYNDFSGSGIYEASLLVYDTLTGKQRRITLGEEALQALTRLGGHYPNDNELALGATNGLMTLSYSGEALITFSEPE